MTDTKPQTIQEMIDERKTALEVALNEIPKDNTGVILKDTATNLTQIIIAILMETQLELEKWVEHFDKADIEPNQKHGAKAATIQIHGGPKYKSPTKKPDEVI